MRTKSEFYKATQACSQKESFGTQIVFYALIFFSGPQLSWLEQAAHNGLVAGSSPAGPTIVNSSYRRGCFFIKHLIEFECCKFQNHHFWESFPNSLVYISFFFNGLIQLEFSSASGTSLFKKLAYRPAYLTIKSYVQVVFQRSFSYKYCSNMILE